SNFCRGYRKTLECRRQAHSSPSSSGTRTTAHPALDAGCAPVENRTRSRESPPHRSDGGWWPRRVGRFCLPGPRPPMVVSVHLLSLCTLFSRASLGTLHDAPGYEDRSSDLPVRAHTPATLRHLLRVRPSSSVSKNFPAADRRSDGGARR